MTDNNANQANANDQETIIIFAKKEIFLIFVFIILFSMLSFAFGIRYGKNMALEKMGITHADQRVVEMKSQKEEDVEKMMSMGKGGSPHSSASMTVSPAPTGEHGKIDGLSQQANELLKNEFAGIDEQAKRADSRGADLVNQHDPNLGVSTAQGNQELEQMMPAPKEKKYTIQLGSYAAQEDALKFADGFRTRGYNPIVSEVKIPGKGIWYRVSLGTFDNMAIAKSYVEKEESLFQGQDYVITDFN